MSQNTDQQTQTPTPPVVRLAAAEVDVAAAKDRLNDTVARLQSKLDPKLLAREATNEVKRVGSEGAALAREHQEVLKGLGVGALIFLLGRPLLRLFRRRKYPKPQKAAKPMTATEPNRRLASRPHPTGPAPAAPHIEASVHPTTYPATPAPTSQSNKGAQLQGIQA